MTRNFKKDFENRWVEVIEEIESSTASGNGQRLTKIIGVTSGKRNWINKIAIEADSSFRVDRARTAGMNTLGASLAG